MEILDNIGEGLELPKDDRIIRDLRIDAMDAQDDLRLGRIALLGMIFLALIGTGVGLYKDGSSILGVLLEGGFKLAVFVWAFFYSEKNPKLAFIVAGVLYLLQILAVAVLISGSLFSGIIFKALIIFFLVKGIKSSSKFEEVRSKLRDYGEELKIPGILNKKY